MSEPTETDNTVPALPALARRSLSTAADADLIGLCDRLAEIEAQWASTAEAIEDDADRERALDPLHTEREAVMGKLYFMPPAATVAGLRAMSRAALAMAPKDADGTRTAIPAEAEWIIFEVARVLTEGAMA